MKRKLSQKFQPGFFVYLVILAENGFRPSILPGKIVIITIIIMTMTINDDDEK